MITTLEILDSAVKIGLGALISGFTAYWLGRDKARLETKKNFQEERRSLIKQVSLDIAKSADAIDDYFHITHITPTANLPRKLSESSALLLTAHKASGQALALASLLGSPPLSTALRAYTASVEEIHRHFAPIEPDAFFDVALAHELAARLDAQLQSVRDALAASYSETDA